jgi:hypothetical protein
MVVALTAAIHSSGGGEHRQDAGAKPASHCSESSSARPMEKNESLPAPPPGGA